MDSWTRYSVASFEICLQQFELFGFLQPNGSKVPDQNLSILKLHVFLKIVPLGDAVSGLVRYVDWVVELVLASTNEESLFLPYTGAQYVSDAIFLSFFGL